MNLSNLEDGYINVLLDKYSEYREEFLNETKHDDILMVILKVHLYIEKEMVELTNSYFKHPKKFNDYTFKSRLDLLFALGVIEKELYDPIKSINDIRNQISHNLDFKFSEVNYKKIYDSLSQNILMEFKKDLEIISKFNVKLDYVTKTKILLACIWTNLKAEVLTAFTRKKELAIEYQQQAIDELIEFKKNQK
jgi:uncharacterized protein YutE (UPF0331/DUF86 family)